MFRAMSCEICSEVLGKRRTDDSDSESDEDSVEPHDLETCEIYPCFECDEIVRSRGDDPKVVIVDTCSESFIIIKSFSELGNKNQVANGDDDDDSDRSSCVTFDDQVSKQKGDAIMIDESDAQSSIA